MLNDSLYYNSAAYDVKQTIDGGYIIIGEVGPNSNNNNDNAIIIKTDSNGYSLWSNVFNASGIGFAEGHSIEQTTDGGYIYAGYASDTGSYSVDFLLVKTDDLGNTTWWKKYQGAQQQTAAFDVQKTTDGGYIIGGVSVEWTGSYDIFIVKTNDLGDTTWTRRIDNGEEGFGSIIQTANGKYIVSSSTSLNQYSDLTLIELGVNGNIISSTNANLVEDSNKNLLKIMDMLGREIIPKSNTPIFYIYDDGTVEKEILIE